MFFKSSKNFILFLLFLATSFVLPFAFPDYNYFWFSWFALVPLIIALNFTTLGTSFLYGWAFGTLFFAQIMIWLYLFGWPPGIAGSLYFSIFIAFFSLTVCWFLKKLTPSDYWLRLFLIPSIWVLFEYLKSIGPLGHTWGDLASSQYKFLLVLQILPWAGGYGLSWLIVLFNTFIAEILYQFFFVGIKRIDKKFKYYTAFTPLLVVFVLFFGNIQLNRLNKDPLLQKPDIKVALVQPSIDQAERGGMDSFKRQLRILDNLTFSTEKFRPQLVVWPETSVFDYLRFSERLCYKFSKMAEDGNFYLLIGAPDIDNYRKKYNSAFLFSPTLGMDDVYAKKHLVPFGEYVMFEKWIGRFEIFDRTGDYSPGKRTVIFNCDFGKFFTLICFESTFSSLAGEGMKAGANFLIVITNDAWFQWTNAAENHLALTVLRSVENKIYTLFCANTGISAIIKPTGEIENYAGLYKRTAVTGIIKSQYKKSFYSSFGPVILWISFLIVIAAFAGVIKRKK